MSSPGPLGFYWPASKLPPPDNPNPNSEIDPTSPPTTPTRESLNEPLPSPLNEPLPSCQESPLRMDWKGFAQDNKGDEQSEEGDEQSEEDDEQSEEDDELNEVESSEESWDSETQTLQKKRKKVLNSEKKAGRTSNGKSGSHCNGGPPRKQAGRKEQRPKSQRARKMQDVHGKKVYRVTKRQPVSSKMNEDALGVARALLDKERCPERLDLSENFIKKMGASVGGEYKEALGPESDLMRMFERETQTVKRVRKTAQEQKDDLGEADASEKTDQEILDIGIEHKAQKARHMHAPMAFSLRGFLLAPYFYLADAKTSTGEYVWSDDVLAKLLRDGDVKSFRQRRDPATSTIVGAKGIRSRAPRKFKLQHNSSGKFMAVAPEEKELSEASRTTLIYKNILGRTQEKTMLRMDPSRAKLEAEALKVAELRTDQVTFGTNLAKQFSTANKYLLNELLQKSNELTEKNAEIDELLSARNTLRAKVRTLTNTVSSRDAQIAEMQEVINSFGQSTRTPATVGCTTGNPEVVTVVTDDTTLPHQPAIDPIAHDEHQLEDGTAPLSSGTRIE